MQFLKTLLVALTVALAVAFAINNWTSVPVALWGGLIADVNLPLLMLLCFLAGLIPPWLALAATRWRLQNRLTSAERAMTDLRSTLSTPSPPAPAAADAPPLLPADQPR